MGDGATIESILSRYPKRVLLRYCESTFGWEDLQALKIIALCEVTEDISSKLADIGVDMQNAKGADKIEEVSRRYTAMSKQIKSTEGKLRCERKKLKKMLKAGSKEEMKRVYREPPASTQP